jgi:hypothetical protein
MGDGGLGSLRILARGNSSVESYQRLAFLEVAGHVLFVSRAIIFRQRQM